MERLLGFDAQLLFDSAVTALNVGILFCVLSYFFFNPVKGYLEKRRNKIAAELESARENESGAKELKAEYERRLASVEAEAAQILRKADQKAKANEARIEKEAKESANKKLLEAEREIELKKARAMEEIRQETVSIAAGMAVQIVSGVMDSKAQKAVIEKILKRMGEITWQA